MSWSELVRIGASRVVEHAPLGAMTTYRVGGTVRALVTLSTRADVDQLLPLIEATSLPLIVIGNGSNLLVADGEHDVVAVHLAGDFTEMQWRDSANGVEVIAGAALDLPVAARRLAGDGITGFEWAVGVPGTFGGAVAMNAGGHGSDMAATLRSVEMWRDGRIQVVMARELALGYRTSRVRSKDLVVGVTMDLVRGEASTSRREISDIVRWRREHQPGGANGGSVFRNPEGDHAGRLIEHAGAKGLRVGTAAVSEKHANFIIADAEGRANDVFEVIRRVRERVLEATGVRLQLEHRLLGFEELE